MPKKIPSYLFLDFALASAGYFLCLVALRPYKFSTWRITETVSAQAGMQAAQLFVVLCLCELLVTYAFRRPYSITDSTGSYLRHFGLLCLLCAPMMSLSLNMSHVIYVYGIEHIGYAWFDHDGRFTLRWYLRSIPSSVEMSLCIFIAMAAACRIRQMRHIIAEITQLNQLLEQEQMAQRERVAKDDAADQITIHGEGKDSLTVRPRDIVYIESLANYLSIVYFNEADICQKRLRCSLRDTEAELEAFPYLVHVHRAFVININFITQVSGNAAGYKVQLFSIDRQIPVSKSNVAAFREKIKSQASTAVGRT